MNHENVIYIQFKVLGIKSILLPKSREEFHDMYLFDIIRYVVTELMETDLY